jgi:hypothetical protein
MKKIIIAICVAALAAVTICKVADQRQKQIEKKAFNTALDRAVYFAKSRQEARLIAKAQEEGLEPFSCSSGKYYLLIKKEGNFEEQIELFTEEGKYFRNSCVLSKYVTDFPVLHDKMGRIEGKNASMIVAL